MNKLIILILMIGVIFSAIVISEPAKPAKPIKGRVASLNDIIKGTDGTVTKERALELANVGQPIVFVVGTGKKAKVYFVYNNDGTYGGKKLAGYAVYTNIGIIGKTKTVNGVNIIIAEMIQSMD